LCLSTQNYIITIEDIEPDPKRDNSLNSHNLTIERNNDALELILYIHYIDYNKLDPDNIRIVENSLTPNDIRQLKTLQKGVDRIKEERHLAWNDALKEVKRFELAAKLERTPYTENLDRIVDAIITILDDRGKEENNLTSYYKSKNLKFQLTNSFDPDRRLHQSLKLFQRDPDGIYDDRLILYATGHAKYSNSLNISMSWSIHSHDLNSLNAERILAKERQIIKKQQVKDLNFYSRIILISWGDRIKHFYQNDRYRIAIEDKSLKIYSLADNRGLIFKIDNRSDFSREDNAFANFNDRDFDWFKKTQKGIRDRQKQINLKYHLELERERSQQRERDGGFQL